MGDRSAEPSMEDILSSIKRIIAEEGDQPIRRGRSTPQVQPADDAQGEPGGPDTRHEVLELSDPLAPVPPGPSEAPEPPFASPPAVSAAPSPAAVSQPAGAPAAPAAQTGAPIVSNEAAAASRGALESLSRMVVRSASGSDGTLEGLVKDMLRPMLRDWLDAHLPALVEEMVSREIARITRP